MFIFSNSTKDNITQLQNKLYDGSLSFNQYLTESLVALHSCLKYYFGMDNYLFTKAYYLESENAPLISVNMSEETDVNFVFYNGIKEAENLVTMGEATSLAEFTVINGVRGVCLYNATKLAKDKIPKFIYHNFDITEAGVENEFLKVDKSKNIKTYTMVLKHEKIAKLYNSEVWSYIMRTRNLDKDFNGSLYFVINREMTVDEYSQIADFFTHIMSARIKYEYKKEILNRTVIDELSHSWKHTFGALKTHIEQIAGSALIKESQQLDYHIQKARIQVSSLNKRNQFLLNLMRGGVNAENAQNFEKENRRNTLSCERVGLKALLLAAAETLQYSTLELGLTKDSHIELIEQKCIPELIKKIEYLKEIKVEAIATGLELVLEDLLKNAVFHTHYANPHVDVYFKDTEGDTMELHITNNTEISDEYSYFINQDRNAERVAKQYKAGIRTVKRIISYPVFNASYGGWKIQCSKENGWTDIYLIIPKSDIRK
jgi:hypothetical protein